MTEFKSRGKYYPRAALWSVAQNYWLDQFKMTILKAQGKDPMAVVEATA